MPFSIFGKTSSVNDASFTECWSLLDQQSPHITCLEISIGRLYLASASEDCTMLFIDADIGDVLGTLDLESCFHVLCASWHSKHSLFAGGLNGVVYDITLNPHNVSLFITIYEKKTKYYE